MAETEEIEMRLDEIFELIDELMGGDDCHLDCLGYCQTHLWFDKTECPHKRAKKILEAIGCNKFTLDINL